MLRAYSRRIESQDADITALEDIRAIREEAEREEHRAVARLREQGYSWAEIALALGTSKSRAIARYGGAPVDPERVRRAGGQPLEMR
jgi:hypothetical protein